MADRGRVVRGRTSVGRTWAGLAGAVVVGLIAGQARAADYFYTYAKRPLALGLDASRIAVFDADAPIGAERGAPDAAATEALRARGLDGAEPERLAVRGWASVPLDGAARDAGDIGALTGGLADSGAFDFVSPVFFDEVGPVIITRDLLVGFYPDITRAEAERLIADEGLGEIIDSGFQGQPGVYRVRSRSRNGIEVLDASNRVSMRAEVRYAEPDMIMTTRHEFFPNDPSFGTQWGLHNTGQSGGTPDMDMNAPEAWDTTVGSSTVMVVVIDDGVDLAHPDLNLAPGMDFTGAGTGGGHDPNNACDNHGTLVSGCISARINNSLQGTGVAPGCRVASAKFSTSNVPCDGSGTFQISWMTGAINWAATIGARVTNNSNGFGPNSSVDNAYTTTRNQGVVHFASSGNGGTGSIGYPSSSPSVNAVGAIARTGARASFSQFGPGLDFSAPGQSIFTTARGGGTSTVNGTSFSSPYAAGVAALLFSRNDLLSPADVESILASTAKDLGAGGFDTTFGHGLLDAAAALASVGPAGPPGAFTLALPSDGATNVSRLPTLEWIGAPAAQSYRIELDDDPAFASPMVDDETPLLELTVPEPALAPNTVYFWRVTAMNNLGMTPSTPASFSFRTISDPPASFNLTMPADGATGVGVTPLFTWSAADRAESYRLRIDDDPAFGSPHLDTVTPLTSSGAGSPLAPETVYYWSVEAINPIGTTASTPSVRSFTTQGTPPGAFSLSAPGDAVNIATLTPVLQWTASLGAASYRVVLDDSSGLSSPLLDQSGVTMTSLAVPPGLLQNSVRYFWSVTAINPFGSATSSPSTASFGVLIVPCEGDANDDRIVDFDDITAILSNWLTAGPSGDANHDGAVNFNDITRVLSKWGLPCP